MKSSLPPGWQSLPLLDIISEDQFQLLWFIIVTEKDPIKRVKKLKAELNKVREQIGGKGVDSDYLAYYLEYTFGRREEAK